MNWFSSVGSIGFTDLAKSALKGAQKTIDKALDIRDEDEEEEEKAADGGENADFFESWGVNDEKATEEMTSANMLDSVKLWGSFKGSYFTTKPDKEPRDEDLIATQPQKLNLSFSSHDTSGLAPLATPETELTPVDHNSGFPSKYTEVDGTMHLSQESNTADPTGAEPPINATEDKVIVRTKIHRNSSNRNSFVSNRLSVISCDSEGKKSSESVEVLGSVSCTTSPDTDLPSISTSSSMGLPVSSSYTDSVEVLDSLASPSSVEVIGDSSSSGRTTQSPLLPLVDIPVVKSSLVVTSPDVSPDSVEVIEQEEEPSIADSYTSASESTGATILEPPYPYASHTDLSQASSKLRSGESTPDIFSRFPISSARHGSCDLLSKSIHEGYDDLESQDLYEYPPVEHGLDSNTRKSRSMHGSPTRRLASKSEDRNTGFVRGDQAAARQQGRAGYSARKELYLSESEGSSSLSSQISQTLTGNESSCEGTLMGSSSDEGNSTPITNQTEVQTTSSAVHVKKLLAEAMNEDSLTRETSPTLSDKSRSDLVKVGSEQTSGHTSGDELETTTSSDIEIISNRGSPNGDSSCTSRQSPAKLGKNKLSLVVVDTLSCVTNIKTKGHQREPSEASSWCSEDTSEVDRLSRRVMELKEIIDARESKVVELLRANEDLQEEMAKRIDMKTDCEKDEMIKELKYEGHKLSKENYQMRELTKQLRKDQLEKSKTIDSIKKKLDEVAQEMQEISNFKSRIILQDKQITGLMNENNAAQVLVDRLQAEAHETRDNQGALQGELNELRVLQSRKESAAKREINSLMQRLQEAEMRNEELAQSVSVASRPLVRQLEALHATTSHERESWEKQERDLLQRLDEAESHLKSVLQHERSFKQETLNLRNKVAALELQLETTKQQTTVREKELSALQTKVEGNMKTRQNETAYLERQVEQLKEQLVEARRDATATEHQLSVERAATEAERRRSAQLVEQLKERGDREVNASPHSSPTLSFGRVSLSESVSSNVWPQFGDDAFDMGSVSGRCSNVYESLRAGNTSSVMEGLQAQLKMRDGEVSHLQWELQRREAERVALATELSSLTSRFEELEASLVQAQAAEKTLIELQKQYDALLQMYGEKVEESDELKLDLEDVKEMYKTQIEQLLRREKSGEVTS